MNYGLFKTFKISQVNISKAALIKAFKNKLIELKTKSR